MKKLLGMYIILQVFNLATAPATIAILRHGEKQLSGQHKPKYTQYLSVKGYERAAALSEMFIMDERFTQYGKPVAIFASGPDKADGSLRPIDTIKPTAKKFKLKVQHQWGATEWKKFVNEIMNNKKYDGKYVIICFEHKHIKYLTSKEGFNAPQAPTTWASSDFDRVFILHMNSEGKVIDFENLPQRLLFGDSKD